MKKNVRFSLLLALAISFGQANLYGQCGGACPATAGAAMTSGSGFSCTSVFGFTVCWPTGNFDLNNLCVFDQGGDCSNDLSSLPIELLYFRGEADGKFNKLEWATAIEENNAVQIVERSFNGKDSWEEIGRVKPAGNSVELQQYGLEDQRPLSLGYYRLHSIDVDGYEQFSEVIVIEREGDKFGIVSVFPNPTFNEVTIYFELELPGEVGATLTDMAGRSIGDFSIDASKGINRIEFDLSDKSAGIYFLTLNDGKNRSTQRLIKQVR